MIKIKQHNSPIQNWLLAKLSRSGYDRLKPHLEPVDLHAGDVLYEPDEPQNYVYFPMTSLVSLVYTMKDGATGEMGLVGRDGVVGVAVYMGGGTRPNRALVQIAGGALRMTAKVFLAELKRSRRLQIVLLRYTQALLTQVSQTAVCNCLHRLEQRLCRWLLLCDDRAGSGQLALTQALLASMLGVRREAVAATARRLQAAKLIRYRRGKVSIIDRHGLEDRVCECYGVVKGETDRLLRAGFPTTAPLLS